MDMIYEERLSDSPYVINYAHSRVESDGYSLLPADGNCYLFVMSHQGQARIAVGGALTQAMALPVKAGTEWIGVRFRLGAFIPHLPAPNLVDNVAFLPEATGKTFWLHGSAWQFPTYENVDTFVDRLIRDEVLVCDPVVGAVLQNQPPEMSLRSVQRRFLQVTGLPHSTILQIERARHAAALLQQGQSILDTVHEAGYFDQPHLTRSLKRFMGQTPAQIAGVKIPE